VLVFFNQTNYITHFVAQTCNVFWSIQLGKTGIDERTVDNMYISCFWVNRYLERADIHIYIVCQSDRHINTLFAIEFNWNTVYKKSASDCYGLIFGVENHLQVKLVNLSKYSFL